LPASLFLIGCVAAGAGPHALPQQQALWPAIGLTVLLGLYAVRTVFLPVLQGRAGAKTDIPALSDWPAVDLVVAARDEEAVIGRLVERLAALRYPSSLLRIWIVDDGSDDRTP